MTLGATTIAVGAGVGASAQTSDSVGQHQLAASAAAASWKALFGVQIAPAGGDTAWDTEVFSDGKRGLTLSEGDLRTYDLTRTPARYLGRTTAVSGRILALRPGRNYAYVADGEDIHVVDVRYSVPKKVRTLTGNSMVRDIALSKDARTMYVAFGYSTSSRYGIRVYSLTTAGKPRWVRTIKTDKPSPSALAVNRQGTRLAVGTDLVGSVQFYSISSPSKPRRLGSATTMPGSNSVSAMEYSPGGTALYVVGRDRPFLTTMSVSKRTVTRNTDLSARFGRYTDGVDLAGTSSGKHLYLLLDGQDGSETVAVISSARWVVETFTGVTYPRGLSVSPAGPTKDNGYFATATTFRSAGYYVGFGPGQ